MNNHHTILQTFKVIRDSQHPIDVEYLQSVTGFDKRRVQRHALVLTNSGLVKKIGDRPSDGYLYKLALPSSAG